MVNLMHAFALGDILQVKLVAFIRYFHYRKARIHTKILNVIKNGVLIYQLSNIKINIYKPSKTTIKIMMKLLTLG